MVGGMTMRSASRAGTPTLGSLTPHLDVEAFGQAAGGLSIADAQLPKDRRDVVVDRLWGKHQPLGDLGIAGALADERQDLQLAA